MRKPWTLRVVVVVVHATIMIACSRDDSASSASGRASTTSVAPASTRLASCDRVPSTSLCSEYTGSYLTQNEAVLSSTCGKLGGAFVQAECPNTSVLGSCSLSTTEVRKFYGSGALAYDAAKAESECVSSYKGKWSAFK